MHEEVWAAQNTTPNAVEEALRGLLAARARTTEWLSVPARVLNLVVVVDRQFRGEIENRLAGVGRYHPSRLVICAVEEGRRRLDAVAALAAEDGRPEPGHIAVTRERVELDIGPKHLSSLATIVDPVLVPDLATVVWSPHGYREAIDSLRHHAQIALIDSLDEPELHVALARAAELTQDLYVVDLAWLRSTPWRERVAAAFDPPALRRTLHEISAVEVRHREDSTAAGALFCGWLASRLGWRPDRLVPRGPGFVGRARAHRGEVTVRLTPVEVGAPGLGGVTVETASGESVSLDRGPGGLRAVRRARDGSEQSWTVLGASRGEGGILGEGVRQALLRDPTYKPALAAAQTMVAR